VAALALVACAGTAMAQSATDDCSLAPIVGDGTFPYDLTGFTNGGGTTGACGSSAAARDGWWQYVPTISGNVTVQTCTFTTADTVLEAYSACGGTRIICNDDACGLQSRISFVVTAGVPVFVRISRFANGAGGDIGSVSIAALVPPPTNPTVVVAASPASIAAGATSLITATVTPGNFPPSTGIGVTGDLTSLGGGVVAFSDDGLTNGDLIAGDNVFSYTITGPSTVCGARYSIPVSVSDAQSRSATGTTTVTVAGSDPSAVWDETVNGGGDAGELPDVAQAVTGTSGASVCAITSTFGASDTDMFRINICDPVSFSASVVGRTGTPALDTQLFLFRLDGTGIAVNDDVVGGTSLESALTSTFVASLPAGEYLLAITRYNRDPVNGTSLLWLNSPFRSERAPDGPAAALPLTGWTGVTTASTNVVSIGLSGVCFIGSGGPTCPACPADFDGNGEIEPVDIRAFFDAFRGENPCADVDGNGEIEPLDVRSFFAVYRDPSLDPECPQ
jgi:hypothetical protein